MLDTFKDERFKDNALVTSDPNIRFYGILFSTFLLYIFSVLHTYYSTLTVGTPVIVDGHILGTVCILDTKPWEEFSNRNMSLLEHLAQLVVHQILSHKETVIVEKDHGALRELIDTSSAPVFGVSAEGKVDEWNSMSEELFGYKAEEIIGQDFLKTLIPEDVAEYTGSVMQPQASDETNHHDSICTTIITKDGENVDVATSCSPRHDKQGKFMSMLCVGQDMSKLGGAQPQIPRRSLARACAFAIPRRL